jgi:hypothetical protein
MRHSERAFDDSTVFRKAPSVVANGEGGHLVLLDFTSGTYYGLDEVGARIWELLHEEFTLAHVVDQLSEEYDAPREILAEDTSALLTVLSSLGLVLTHE